MRVLLQLKRLSLCVLVAAIVGGMFFVVHALSTTGVTVAASEGSSGDGDDGGGSDFA